MPKTEYEKGYEDGFSDGFRLCQKIYSNVIDLLCKAFQKKEQKERKLIPNSHKEEAKEEVSGTFQLTETCRLEMLSTPRQIPCWISVLSKVSAPWKYILDVHDTITAIRASTGRQNSAVGTIQVLTYLLHDGKKFLMTPERTMSAGRLEYHICDADFAGGFGCRHFLCVSLLLIFRHIVRN